MIPQHTINHIRETASDNIIELIGEHVQLKRAGSSMKGKCPFHEENTASFSVSEQKGIYKCFGCGQGGDAVDFIIKHTGREFIEVIRELADRYHIPIEEETSGQNAVGSGLIHQSFIPKDVRAKIRKSGYCILFFTEKEAEQFTDRKTAPWMQVSWPLKSFEAAALKKYTTTVFFRADSARAGNDKFWESLQAFLGLETEVGETLAVFIQSDDAAPQTEKQKYGNGVDFPYSQEWIDFALEKLPPNPWLRKKLIQTIGAIKDNITRGIYTQHFIEKWRERTLTIHDHP